VSEKTPSPKPSQSPGANYIQVASHPGLPFVFSNPTDHDHHYLHPGQPFVISNTTDHDHHYLHPGLPFVISNHDHHYLHPGQPFFISNPTDHPLRGWKLGRS
jgi:hypothetical protein